METNTSRMITLNGSNYRMWKTRMEDFLYVNGFHQPMICSEKPHDKTNEEWNLLNRRVCGFIRHWVDDSVLNHVSEETNTRRLWIKLEQLYDQKALNSTAADDVISVESVENNNVLNEETTRKSQNSELQGLKTLKIAFHHATKDEVVIHSIRLPKQSTVGDVINELKTKVELSHKDAELRLLEESYLIYKILPLNEKILNFNVYWVLRAEEIPEEEKNLDPEDRLIRVYHFTKDIVQNLKLRNFGEPFFVVIREGETLAELKIRIQKKLQVPDDEFSKWEFTIHSKGQSRPRYLENSDVVSNRFLKNDFYGLREQQHLGLVHSDTTSKRPCAANQ